MPGSLQAFLAKGIQKTAEDLEAAYLRLPEDKRRWSPQGDARTAADMVAECALLHGTTPDIVRDRAFPKDMDMGAYHKAKDALAADPDLLGKLKESTAKAVGAAKSVPDSDLDIEIAAPWGSLTIAQALAYPYWNACYHEGQINYIASMLGCLD